MKSLARAYIWWPEMDSQIEELVKTCTVCQESRPLPPAAPLHPWEWPSQPWSRIHIDYFGPFLNHMFMVVVDAHSKWMDACIMPSITSAKAIEQLRILFATHGLPRKVVTDNGPSFTSEEFHSFLSYNSLGKILNFVHFVLFRSYQGQINVRCPVSVLYPTCHLHFIMSLHIGYVMLPYFCSTYRHPIFPYSKPSLQYSWTILIHQWILTCHLPCSKSVQQYILTSFLMLLCHNTVF